MASIQVKFRLSSPKGREGIVFYQIFHKKSVSQIPTPYKILKTEWDKKRKKVTANGKSSRLLTILSIQEMIQYDTELLNRIIKKLEREERDYTSTDILADFEEYAQIFSLFNFMEKLILQLYHNGQIRTSETYQAALNSFRKFRKNEDVRLDQLNATIMERYECWLRDKGLIPNSIGFYMRILRAVYNRAVKEGKVDDRRPFREVYTGVDKTAKRALPLATLKQILMVDLSNHPQIDYARDMFLMSFYLRGMSFIDMAFLKKSDLKNGILTYRRRKTGQPLTISWEPEMQSIIEKYPANPTPYLMPIITRLEDNERTTYRNKSCTINRNLGKLAKMIGITGSITLYVARHSWASIAKTQGIPISIISEGLGHSSETTTNIYLASLESAAVDRANNLILRSLK